MRRIIEDFSVPSPMVNTENNSQNPEAVVLTVEEWNIMTKVAYTVNSHNIATAKQLYLALQKYKELLFAVGVEDYDENRMVQRTMQDYMKELYRNKVTTEVLEGRYEYTLFKLKNVEHK